MIMDRILLPSKKLNFVLALVYGATLSSYGRINIGRFIILAFHLHSFQV